MKIGITARFEVSSRGDLFFVFEKTLLHAIRDYLPNAAISLLTPENKLRVKDLDLIIFPGGSTPGMDSSRDEFEQLIYNEGSESIVPMLGICRGAQLFAFYSGARLELVKNHVDSVRQTKGYIPLGTCYHNWGIPQLPPQWNVLSRDSEDESIELFRHHELPIVGVLAHPERSSLSRSYFKQLLNLIQ